MGVIFSRCRLSPGVEWHDVQLARGTLWPDGPIEAPLHARARAYAARAAIVWPANIVFMALVGFASHLWVGPQDAWWEVFIWAVPLGILLGILWCDRIPQRGTAAALKRYEDGIIRVRRGRWMWVEMPHVAAYKAKQVEVVNDDGWWLVLDGQRLPIQDGAMLRLAIMP